MKTLLLSLTTIALATTAFADIQDPPMNDQGPTRKLGRALSNLAFGLSELPTSMQLINDRDGNAAAATYGVVKGVTRSLFRVGAGAYELFTFPFASYRSSYRAPYKSNVPWINSGYEEFPPELGWQTRRQYVRSSYGY